MPIIQKINLYDLDSQECPSSDEDEQPLSQVRQRQIQNKSSQIQSTSSTINSNKTATAPKTPAIELTYFQQHGHTSQSLNGKIASKFFKPAYGQTMQSVVTMIGSQLAQRIRTKPPDTPLRLSSPIKLKTRESSSNSSEVVKHKLESAIISSDTRPVKSNNSETQREVASSLEYDIVVKEEAVEIDETPVIQETWQNLDESMFIKQEKELIVTANDDECESFVDQEENAENSKEVNQCKSNENLDETLQQLNAKDSNNSDSEDSEYNLDNSDIFSLDTDMGILDEKLGFFYKGSNGLHKTDDYSEENSAKKFKSSDGSPIIVSKSQATALVDALPKGITVKKTTTRQVACKSTSSFLNSSDKTELNVTMVKSGENSHSVSKNQEQVEAKIKEEPSEDIEMEDVRFGQNVEENSEKVDQNSVRNEKIVVKTGKIQLSEISQITSSSTMFGDSSEILGGLSIKTEPIEPEKIFGVKIKLEKLDYDEVETKTVNDLNLSGESHSKTIKEENLDDYLAAGPSGLNSSKSFDNQSIISTKIVTIPASSTSKQRRIIVIKKPLPPGTPKPPSGQIVRKISLADFEKLGANKSIKKITRTSSSTKVIATEMTGGNGAGNMRYIVKSIPKQTMISPNSIGQSALLISNITSALPPGLATKPTSTSTTVTFPKTNKKIVVNKQNPIYRCQKCHLLFTSHSEYTDHLKEHKQGIVFNEKRVIKLEEVQKMNQFQCSQCNAGFPTLEKLSMHENRHKTEFVCKYCYKKFLLLYRYKEHLMTHATKKDKYIECEHCDKKFLKQERFDEHMTLFHFPKEIYPCGVCDKKFPSHEATMEHIKISHSKRLPMKCGLCSYETFVKQNFEKHAGMHLRYVEKLNSNTFFKCDQCPQSFREESVLKMHKNHMHS